jgi:DNA replication initiation complex subunit (GINS family)
MDKYAGYRYEIQSETELDEAKWLIEQGFYKDLEDYINRLTLMEIRIMKRQDAEKKKRMAARKKRHIITINKDIAA